MGEIGRLLPKDGSPQILLALDPLTFSRIETELRAYGVLHEAEPIFPGSGPSLKTYRFGGWSICCLPEHVKLDG